MSLAVIWSGSFHQLKNSFGSSCRLLRFYSGLTSGNVIDSRRHELRPLATKVEGRNQKSESSKSCSIDLNLRESSANININQSESHEFKAVQAVQCYDIQQTFDKKASDRLATVLVFDLETTGFSPSQDRIIEIAVRDLIGGKNSTFQSLVNPQQPVTNSTVHKIRSGDVNRPGIPRFDQLLKILLEYVRSRQMVGKPVIWVAHNAWKFDVPFIIREFQRCSAEVPEDWLFVDTLPLAHQVVPPEVKADGSTKRGKTNLAAMMEHYGITSVGPAHRAMADVMTLSAVLQRLTFDLKLTTKGLMDKAFRASDLLVTDPKVSSSKGKKA